MRMLEPLHVFQVLLFILPAYFANSFPVLFGGRGPKMDFGKNFFDGRRIFGDGKTWQGFFAGILIALAVGVAFYFALPGSGLGFYTSPENYILLGLSAGIGTMLGDATGSFVKRRINMKPGAPMFVMDQLLFLYTALFFIFVLGVSIISWLDVLWLTVLTYVVHRGANIVANRMGWKRVPW
jgi:CDP-2,3-bis-(O-geranylgeranyl)-sn-glycerol synthase